ncbi:MAG: carbamoyl-phosphate synthase large subunit [Alphaproteobacteria bacterium]|nr:carbamoyl-phosphate synthase large subunit [Alphaproteobacteria bacterium]MCB9929884.1 carbamoyl-phosphate synthase large subunit [Alphaproteobacteria bacterium]
MISGKLLVANRGEIATRIVRAAAELGLPTVAVYPADDAASLHTRKADEAVQLSGRGVAAYLDADAILAAAKETGATAIHPGYGFLSENAAFARACAAAGIVFVGPSPEALELFGDKHAARRLAAEQDVPTLPGTAAPTALEDARAFLADLGPGGAVMVKAVAGGGGRGMRPVLNADDLEEAFARCQSEALSGFGNGDLYVERLVRRARHIEVQVVGDGREVSHLWERDCSLQRRRQKIVELAPAPDLSPVLRDKLLEAAMRLAAAAGYKNLGTIEFLVDADTGEFFFIEANPRLQVEHTVTEEVTGLNLVELQLQIAGGQTLADLGLTRAQVPSPRGMAMQVRVNTETMQPDGEARPGGGVLSAFEPPSGRGIRVDHYGYVGYRTNPAYDSLLAKLVVHTSSQSLPDVLAKGYRALCEFHVAGAPTNIPFLQNLLRDEGVAGGGAHTGYVEAHAAALVQAAGAHHPHLYFAPTTEAGGGAARSGRAGVKVDAVDPLAVLAFGQSDARQGSAARSAAEESLADGMIAVRAPLQGTILSLTVAEGDTVLRGQQLVVMEAMKMEHEVKAEAAGIVRAVHVEPGDTLWEDQLLIALEPSDAAGDAEVAAEEIDPDYIRPDLAEVLERKSRIYDENRPQAVARRRKTGHRTARENVYDLVDPDTFIEYGSMVVAAQVRRRGLEDLYTRSPADGIIVGVGQVNGEQFGDPESRVVVLAYDYTVFAGTQGVHNHWKTDKGIDIADDGRMPVILFAEGGGGRPGDDDYGGFVGMDTFHHFMKLSGHVPIVCVVAGRCYAGNASLVGASDVVIATRDANIGMGGPAMVEGGGLGVFAPEDIGPTEVQFKNGVIDVLVEDEAEAVRVAKKYLSYFQGKLPDWTAPDQRRMRHIVPENRLRIYEIRDVIETLADEGSVLELRQGFGKTIVTCLTRIEGRPVGIIANDPKHLGGAIDSDGSDKGARFMQLCDAYDIPIVHLCDTPGIMVGPEVEKTALVRHAARMFVTSANLTVPYFTVITRKAYGLGQSAMAGGNLRFPYFYVAWPTGEFAPMGIEGQVKLGYRAELEAVADPEERRQLFEKLVAGLYESGKAINRTTNFSLDEVIDPADTRKWVVNLLASIRPPAPRDRKKRPMVDTW